MQALYRARNLVIARHENLLLSAWWGSSSPESARAFRDVVREFVQANPGEAISLSILREIKMRSLPKEEREPLEEAMREMGPRWRAEAIILDGSPLLVGVLRLMTSALRLAGRRQSPFQIFASQAEGLSWIAPYAGRTVSSLGTLLQNVEALRPA